MSQRGWRTLGEHEPQSQLNKAHMSSQRQQQQVQGLHGSTPSPTGLCYSYWLRVFMEFLTEWIRLWQLGRRLGIFSCSVVFNIYMKFITLYFLLPKVKTKPYLQQKREKRKSKNSARYTGHDCIFCNTAQAVGFYWLCLIGNKILW